MEIFPAPDPPHPRIARHREPLPKTIQLLRSRRARLHRFIERIQETIAEIEAELRRRGVDPGKPPRARPRKSPFRHCELPRLCIGALRAAGRPLHICDLVAAVLATKRLTPTVIKNDRWCESLFGAPPPPVSRGATRRAIPTAEIVERGNDFGGWYHTRLEVD